MKKINYDPALIPFRIRACECQLEDFNQKIGLWMSELRMTTDEETAKFCNKKLRSYFRLKKMIEKEILELNEIMYSDDYNLIMEQHLFVRKALSNFIFNGGN